MPQLLGLAAMAHPQVTPRMGGLSTGASPPIRTVKRSALLSAVRALSPAALGPYVLATDAAAAPATSSSRRLAEASGGGGSSGEGAVPILWLSEMITVSAASQLHARCLYGSTLQAEATILITSNTFQHMYKVLACSPCTAFCQLLCVSYCCFPLSPADFGADKCTGQDAS